MGSVKKSYYRWHLSTAGVMFVVKSSLVQPPNITTASQRWLLYSLQPAHLSSVVTFAFKRIVHSLGKENHCRQLTFRYTVYLCCREVSIKNWHLSNIKYSSLKCVLYCLQSASSAFSYWMYQVMIKTKNRVKQVNKKILNIFFCKYVWKIKRFNTYWARQRIFLTKNFISRNRIFGRVNVNNKNKAKESVRNAGLLVEYCSWEKTQYSFLMALPYFLSKYCYYLK